MAKKKKPAANPARGFATTSIASKPKPEVAVEKEPQNLADSNDLEKSETAIQQNSSLTNGNPPKEKDLHELSPEELTEQLERNELQQLVDNYGPKVRREVARLESKLRSDGRVLRAQALDVSLRRWLPDELMLEIADLIKLDNDETNRAPVSPGSKTVSEKGLLLHCWTLWETLVGIGISEVNVKSTVEAIIRNPPTEGSGSYIWGFREAIEYLACNLDENALPAYDARKSRSAVPRSSANSGLSTPADSAFASPEPSPPPTMRSALSHERNTDENEASEDVSLGDYDSEVEPDDLIGYYLSIKERLYRHKPQLVDGQPTKGKKGRQNATFAATATPTKPNERRLHSKLTMIESDALFDNHEAEQRWTLRRIQLMQEAAAARQISNTTNLVASTGLANLDGSGDKLDNKVAAHASSEEGSQDDDQDILGAMFTIEESRDVPPTIATSETGNMRLRDMGKFAGLSPRRIFEDACRALDPKANITFRKVSASSQNVRHSVTIRWLNEQEKITGEPVEYVRMDQRLSGRTSGMVSDMAFIMTEVACPDQKQSEGFIATVALFYVMTTSKKDEKQYLKLPPNFRDLYLELASHRKQQVDTADRTTVKAILDMVRAHLQQQEDDGVVLTAAFRNRGLNSPRPGSSRDQSPSRVAAYGMNTELMQVWQTVQSSSRFQQMLRVRMSLPMFEFKEAALAAIDSSQVIILCGETGCGKSTQLPSYVLEHELSHGRNCKIYCTQPRRISAISLAQRVSEELGEQSGDVGTNRSLVGYAIRLESKISARTRLVYATVGVVLRMLESSKSLDGITHLIIDEVHERSIDTDFLLIVLKTLMIRRSELKVVLMSATVDATRFSRYLNNAPIINVPGRTFPVQTKYLEDAIELTGFIGENMKPQATSEDDEDGGQIEGGMSGIPKQLPGYSPATRTTLSQYDEYRIDYELIVRLMEQIAHDPAYTDFSKATLVFLPGIAEIRELNNMLMSSPVFQHHCWVIPLHSTIANEEQQLAFRIPPRGTRKVVLATNIAETGITIPDVTCVIDTGKHKEMRFDERRQLSRLIQSFISRANAKQRRGRAGRVQEGLCFHLFTKHRHDNIMAEQQTPEMLRLALQDLAMRVKICGLGQIENTLAQAMDPPLAKNVRRAIDALIEVGALTAGEDLTALGTKLADIPLDANLGKLCLMSAIFGCLDVGLTIAAILTSKSPFVTPFGDRQRADLARLTFAKGDSDLLTAYSAYTTWRRVCQAPNESVHAFCKKHFLSHQNLRNIEDLKAQLLSSVEATGVLRIANATGVGRNRQNGFVQVPAQFDTNSANDSLVQAVIAWAFYPKLLIREGKGYRNIANSQQVSLHPTSVNKTNRDAKFLSYYSMMASSAGAKYYNALSTTAVADVPLVALAGEGDWKMHAGLMIIDGNRLRFRVGAWKEAVALKMMRQKLQELVDSRLKSPGKDLSASTKLWLNIWIRMCESFEERSKKTA